MNHAEHDESIGSMLASIAEALREVSDKLDIVAARVQLDVPTFPVDEDLPDHLRIRRLESWAFRASQDISRLSSRLDALDNEGEPDSGRPARGTRSRREVREAAEAAERAVDGFDDPDPPPSHQSRDGEGSRPPLERRNAPVRPTTDHLGDPTALAATPIPRTVAAEPVAPFGQPISFDSDSPAAAGGGDGSTEPPSRRPVPARLSGATGPGNATAVPAEQVGVPLVGTVASANGFSASGSVGGVAGDIASPRNGTAVPALIAPASTASDVDHTSGFRAPAKTTAVSLSQDRAPTSGINGADLGTTPVVDTAPGASPSESAEVSAGVRADDVPTVVGLSSGAIDHVSGSPDDGSEADGRQTAEGGPAAGVERARPVKKPAEVSGSHTLGVALPDEYSGNGNGAGRRLPAESAHAVNGRLPSSNEQLPSGFTSERPAAAPNGKPVNGFDSHATEVARLRGEPGPADDFQPTPSADAQSAGNTANGIHWSFTEDPTSTSPAPDRNGHARNGFTTDSARRSDSLFDDFTPRDRLSTGDSPEAPPVSGPPARLSSPAEPAARPNHVPADPSRVTASTHVNGSAHPRLSSPERSAHTGGLPDHNGAADHSSLTHHATLTSEGRTSADFDPPTLGLPTGREGSTTPDPLERPIAEPIPPTDTDSAGITVTGTYRAFDIERAHVDKLQAMLDELKRSAGLPPGRRDVFGPPTPDLG